MLAPGAKIIVGALVKESALDTALSGIGVSAALVSASFAAYMVVVGPQGGTGRGSAPLIAAVPVPGHRTLAAAAPLPAGSALSDGIDFTPTGSIPDLDDGSDSKDRALDPKAELSDFAVRDVFDGTALIEARGTLKMVTVGATLDGAGEILGIEQRGPAWIVKTAGGIIRQRH